MKIFALIPDNYLKAAMDCALHFDVKCCLGLNAEKEMTLILKVNDSEGKIINGTQYIADLTEGNGE